MMQQVEDFDRLCALFLVLLPETLPRRILSCSQSTDETPHAVVIFHEHLKNAVDRPLILRIR